MDSREYVLAVYEHHNEETEVVECDTSIDNNSHEGVDKYLHRERDYFHDHQGHRPATEM